jgi:hypothetical protein
MNLVSNIQNNIKEPYVRSVECIDSLLKALHSAIKDVPRGYNYTPYLSVKDVHVTAMLSPSNDNCVSEGRSLKRALEL